MTITTQPSPLVSTTILDNGLGVTLETGWASPHAAVAWHFPVGMVDDPPHAPGLAHLVEHLLFQDVVQGAGDTPAERHRAQGGGFRDGTTHLEYTDYYRRVGPSGLRDAVEFDARRFTAPRFRAPDLAAQRAAIDQEARGRSAKVLAGFPWPMLHRALQDDPAAGRDGIGSAESLGSVTAGDCSEFFATHYSPEGAHVTIVAHDIDAETRRHILAALAAIPVGSGRRPRALRSSLGPASAGRPATERTEPSHAERMRTAMIRDDGVRDSTVFAVLPLPDAAACVASHLAALAAFDAAVTAAGLSPASRGAFGLLDTRRPDYAVSVAPTRADAEVVAAAVGDGLATVRNGGTRAWRSARARLLSDVYALLSDVSSRARLRGRLACLRVEVVPEDVVLAIGAMTEADAPSISPITVTVAPMDTPSAPPGKDTR